MKRLAVWVIGCLAAICQAATYYVSPYGDGTGSGADMNNPKAAGTLSSWLSEGDVVYFRDPNFVISWQRWPTGVTYYTNEVHLFNITWTLNQDVRVGQFINPGMDAWLLATEGAQITAIDPCSFEGNGVKTTTTSSGTWTPADGRWVNGTMVYGCGLAPCTVGYQAYDSLLTQAAMAYNRGKEDSLPLDINQPGMVISVASRFSGGTTNGNGKLDDAAVLTIVSEVPDPNSFRPGYCDPNAEVKYTTDDINWDCVESWDPCGVAVPKRTYSSTPIAIEQTTATEALSTSFERMVSRPWISNATGLLATANMAPVNNMPAYNAYQHACLALVGLVIHVNHWSVEDRTNAIYGYLQIGLDWSSYHALDGVTRVNDGGGGSYYRWPCLFAAMVFDDNDLRNDDVYYGEEGGTFYVEAGEPNETAQYRTGGDIRDIPYQITSGSTFRGSYYGIDGPEYVSGHVGMPEWGVRAGWNYKTHNGYTDEHHNFDKDYTSPQWVWSYRQTGNGYNFMPTALTMMIVHDTNDLSGKAFWGDEALAYCDYADRFRINEATLRGVTQRYDIIVDHGLAGDELACRYAWDFWTIHRPLLKTEFPVWNDNNNDGVSESDPYDLVPPGVPTNLRASATTASLTISWDPPAAASDGDTASAYRIWFETGEKAACTVTAACYDESYDTNSIEITALDDGTAYTISVAAIDNFGIESLTYVSGTFWTDEEGEVPPTIPEQAQGPSPEDEDTRIDVDVELSWIAGTNATTHHVYFGTDEAAVTAATTSTPTIYRGEQAEITYTPGTLSYRTIYYWRIDEENVTGVTKGDTWSFTTEGEQKTFLWVVP